MLCYVMLCYGLIRYMSCPPWWSYRRNDRFQWRNASFSQWRKLLMTEIIFLRVNVPLEWHGLSVLVTLTDDVLMSPMTSMTAVHWSVTFVMHDSVKHDFSRWRGSWQTWTVYWGPVNKALSAGLSTRLLTSKLILDQARHRNGIGPMRNECGRY